MKRIVLGHPPGRLMARDRAVEDWLRNQVGSAYDALKADPSRALTAKQVLARLVADHKNSTLEE